MNSAIANNLLLYIESGSISVSHVIPVFAAAAAL